MPCWSGSAGMPQTARNDHDFLRDQKVYSYCIFFYPYLAGYGNRIQ